jgi:putative DNA methylase
VEPVIEGNTYRFAIKYGPPPAGAVEGTKAIGRGANFTCLISGVPISGDYIKHEGQVGRIGARLLAIVAEGNKRRLYLPPSDEAENIARRAEPAWKPSGEVPPKLTGGTCVPYGMKEWGDLFTKRQLVALTTFSELIMETRDRVLRDAVASGLSDDSKPLSVGGTGAPAYADAVAVYLAMAVDRVANTLCTIARWTTERQQTVTAFARQAIPMTWDFPEVNPFAQAAGDFGVSVEGVIKGIPDTNTVPGFSSQDDASTQQLSKNKIISTDPPYYDNISYADLSDFFYVWLRRSLKGLFPDLFSTVTVPKAEELVATAYRHGGKEQAEIFFLNGMTQAMQRLADQGHPAFPVTIYYAFKQSETETEGTSSTGWETFLDAVIRAGFSLTGTWPMRTELGNRMIGSGTNALDSSIILVCRPRALSAPTATRGDFHKQLRSELPEALKNLQRGNIAPVDLAQAAIGPGMGVFTRYSKVIDAAGKVLSVHDALSLINQTLDEVLAEQEGDFDADSRWALAWFDQFGFAEGEYGLAETLSKAKNTSLSGLVDAGILLSKGGKVRLMKPTELQIDWRPDTDDGLTAWEIVHHLVRSLESGGEQAAAALVEPLGSGAEVVRELAYRLYTLCERKKRAPEALSYNNLVQSWPEINRLSRQQEESKPKQDVLFQEIEDK